MIKQTSRNSVDYTCQCCGTKEMSVFYEISDVPVHSVLLLKTKHEALTYPTGDIVLGFCNQCGLIANVVFDPNLHEYSASYEETQGFSPTFNAFHRELATHLIERYGLHNKNIMEIGCGKGEFLSLLCELGDNRGVGYDPAYVDERNKNTDKARTTFIKDFYSDKYSGSKCDFVCCKMTLEHIQFPADFISTISHCIGDCSDTIVFFQVPDVTRILEELAFWDIYYEHCSYFSPGSLTSLFRKCGFEVRDLWKGYDAQYIMIEARPGNNKLTQTLTHENDFEQLKRSVEYFSNNYQQKLNRWKAELTRIRKDGLRAVLWGAGSKAVTFLTTLKIQEVIPYAVDINPHKHETYMAGTGHKIVSPEFLREYRPDVVILMNSIYYEEVRQDLNRMGLTPDIVTV